MHISSWADNRTLIGCQCLLAAMFSVALYGVSRLYPRQRGVGSLSLGFAMVIPPTILLNHRAGAFSPLSIAGANIPLLFAYIFLYRGILLFSAARQGPAPERRRRGEQCAGADGYLPVLYGAALLTTVVLVYFSAVHDRFAARIAAIGLYMAFARALIAIALWRNADGRMHMKLFSVSLACFSVISVGVSMAEREGTLAGTINPDSKTLFLLVTFLFVCVNGMFYLAMVAHAVADTIAERAELDFLTGTLNRRGIESALQLELARTRRRAEPLSVLLIDVDHFKTINDRHGHGAGDEALRRAAAGIESAVRTSDRLGRYGGDEFLLLMPGSDGAEAMVIAERIRRAVHAPAVSDRAPALSLSIGVTCCSEEEAMDDILARADAALYAAKRGGRDRACLLERRIAEAVSDEPRTVNRGLFDRVGEV
jgi:diguanylate cyclase (GGDEF)-like protein